MAPGRQRQTCCLFFIYLIICLFAAIYSVRHEIHPYLFTPEPAWIKLPPIPYAPHLPPARHPSVAHLTPDQKHSLEALSFYGYPSPQHPGKHRSVASLQKLYACVMDPERRCEATPRGRVIILEADYFRWALEGRNDGEHIWAKSVLKAFDELGYTVLVSESAAETNELYSALSGAVALVVKTRDEMEKCVQSSRSGKLGGCLDGEHNTRGIPVWKILSMYFFPNPAHPLGTGWTLSPEPYHMAGALGSDARYIGYSIEDACLSVPVVPADKRENRAYILAKYHDYFTSHETAWDLASFPKIAAHSAVKFVGGWIQRGNPHASAEVEGVENLGPMERTKFVGEVAKSKALVGMGNPVISPTPYEALCLGVPFINPIREWNRDDPDNRDTWLSQHNGLHELSPPYVYHVFEHDDDALAKAVQSAMATSIDRHILPRMRQSEVNERVRKIVEEVDWWKKWRDLGEQGRILKSSHENSDQ